MGIRNVDVAPGSEGDAAARVLAKIVGGNVGEAVDRNVAAGGKGDIVVGPHIVVVIGPDRAQEDVTAGRHGNATSRRADGITIHGVRAVRGRANGRQYDVS